MGAGSDTVRVYADYAGADTATYVFAAPTTGSNVRYVRLPVPDCVDASEVTAVDCNGDAITVQQNVTAGGLCTSLDFGTSFQPFVGLALDSSDCEGAFTFSVTMPGAGLHIGDTTSLLIGSSTGYEIDDCARCDAAGASFTCAGAEVLSTCNLVCATHTGSGCIQTPTCSGATHTCTSGQYNNQSCVTDADCGYVRVRACR